MKTIEIESASDSAEKVIHLEKIFIRQVLTDNNSVPIIIFTKKPGLFYGSKKYNISFNGRIKKSTQSVTADAFALKRYEHQNIFVILQFNKLEIDGKNFLGVIDADEFTKEELYSLKLYNGYNMLFKCHVLHFFAPHQSDGVVFDCADGKLYESVQVKKISPEITVFTVGSAGAMFTSKLESQKRWLICQSKKDDWKSAKNILFQNDNYKNLRWITLKVEEIFDKDYFVPQEWEFHKAVLRETEK